MARLLIFSIFLLWLMTAPVYAQENAESLLKPFTRLPGQVSVLVEKDDVAVAELNADESLAVASAFKLAVLQVLQQQVQAGEHTWDEVIRLTPEEKSLPSGILQDWPDQTPMTVQTLATLMMAVSDNTAADALMQILGPIKSRANDPLLTTRQVFTLKNPENRALLERYRQSNRNHDLLAQVAQAPLPTVELVDRVPLAPDVEWFFSTRELCGYMEAVADLPLMHINTGIINPQAWQSIAFKGGSEPGVLNLTAALTSKTSQHYCVSATWNDGQPLNDYRFFEAYSDLIDTLSTAS